jgi:AcrR family transcriptional regulator
MRPGSIYAAFGSKAGLFEAALDRYSRDMSDEFAAVVAEAGGPLDGIRSYLREVARACAGAGPDGRWPTPGCMLVKTMLELGDEDVDLRERAERVLASVEDHLTALLRQAGERGELVPEARPRRLARLLQAQIMGLRAFARRRVPARALTELDTAGRRSELAGALAYWAVSYMELPGDPTHEHGERTARAALATVPRVPTADRPREGSISDRLGALQALDGFGDAVARLDADRPNAVVGLDLAAAFAAMFLEQARGPLEAIVHAHALTGVAAAMRLAPLVNARAARRLLAHAWQNGCGLFAAYGAEPLEVPPLDGGSGPDDLAAAAVRHGDEHVIKLTEVCLEFHDLTGAGRFLRVPQQAMSVLSPEGPRG